MKKEITVTQEDIDSGTLDNGESCPIAQALIRMNYDDVFVDEQILTICDEKIVLPLICTDFITNFDDGKKVQPFSFMLDLPDWLL